MGILDVISLNLNDTFDFCCSHQSVVSPSACVRAVGGHFVVFSWCSVLKLILRFLNFGFYCLTVLFIAKM